LQQGLEAIYCCKDLLQGLARVSWALGDIVAHWAYSWNTDLAMVPGVVLSVAEETNTPCTVSAEHFERFVDVLVAVRYRSSKVLIRQLGAEFDDAMMPAGLDAAVHRVAVITQTLGTVEAVMRRQCNRRPRPLLTDIARRHLRHGAVGNPVNLDQLLDERVSR